MYRCVPAENRFERVGVGECSHGQHDVHQGSRSERPPIHARSHVLGSIYNARHHESRRIHVESVHHSISNHTKYPQLKRKSYNTSVFIGDGKTPQCCNATSGDHLDDSLLHPFCLPIDIDPNDGFYKNYNQTCMTFVRTNIGADYACTLGHAEQVYIIENVSFVTSRLTLCYHILVDQCYYALAGWLDRLWEFDGRAAFAETRAGWPSQGDRLRGGQRAVAFEAQLFRPHLLLRRYKSP